MLRLGGIGKAVLTLTLRLTPTLIVSTPPHYSVSAILPVLVNWLGFAMFFVASLVIAIYLTLRVIRILLLSLVGHIEGIIPSCQDWIGIQLVGLAMVFCPLVTFRLIYALTLGLLETGSNRHRPGCQT